MANVQNIHTPVRPPSRGAEPNTAPRPGRGWLEKSWWVGQGSSLTLGSPRAVPAALQGPRDRRSEGQTREWWGPEHPLSPRAGGGEQRRFRSENFPCGLCACTSEGRGGPGSRRGGLLGRTGQALAPEPRPGGHAQLSSALFPAWGGKGRRRWLWVTLVGRSSSLRHSG